MQGQHCADLLLQVLIKMVINVIHTSFSASIRKEFFQNVGKFTCLSLEYFTLLYLLDILSGDAIKNSFLSSITCQIIIPAAVQLSEAALFFPAHYFFDLPYICPTMGISLLFWLYLPSPPHLWLGSRDQSIEADVYCGAGNKGKEAAAPGRDFLTD